MLSFSNVRLAEGKKDLPHRQKVTGNEIVFVSIIDGRTEFIDDDMLDDDNERLDQ